MTLIGIGPFWLYRSIFFLFSHTSKVKQADETLRRIYNRNCKTLSINRAGKHHRGFHPSSCPRDCSLLSSNKLDTHNLIYQSINLGGFFFLHLKLFNYSTLAIHFFVGSQKQRRSMLPAVLGSMYVVLSTFPPIMLQNVGPFYFTFDLAIVAVVVSFTFIPFLEKMAKSIHWLEHTLGFAFSTLTFSYLCCWPHQIGNMFSIYTELAFVALFGSLFGCLAIFLKPAATRPRLAISNTDNGNL
jgi:hypothetical protein